MRNKNLLRCKVFCNWFIPEKIYTIPMQEISATIQGGGGGEMFSDIEREGEASLDVILSKRLHHLKTHDCSCCRCMERFIKKS